MLGKGGKETLAFPTRPPRAGVGEAEGDCLAQRFAAYLTQATWAYYLVAQPVVLEAGLLLTPGWADRQTEGAHSPVSQARQRRPPGLHRHSSA